MKKLKLFPKIFIYTLALLLLITMLASGTIYLLAPMMGENSVLSEGTYVDGMSSAIRTAAIPRNTEIAHTILRSLPYTIAICIVVSLLCAYFFSKAITNPIKGILDATNHMAVLNRKAACKTATNDEIGILANQINQLYQNLLSTIEHLQEEKDKVSEAEKQKIDFLRSASHELKTPIAVVNANAEMLQRDIGENQWLANIQYENERMRLLVGQLLELARTENVQPQTARLDFSHLTTGEVLPFESVAYEKGLSIKAEILPDLWIDGDSIQLKLLISILIDNAIRHSENGNNIVVKLTESRISVILSVENSGKLIPPEQQERLFDRFYRVDDARNSEDNHYGLGLAIAKAIVTTHNGKIEIRCYDGLVEFSVTIPKA